MSMTRRDFVRGGVAAFTVGFAAPRFLSRPGAGPGPVAPQPRRPLSERRQRRAQHADSLHRPAVLRAPSDACDPRRQRAADRLRQSPAARSGLHPRLTGLRTIFNAGRLAIVQRTGYPNSSRSHFEGTDIWSTGDPASAAGNGMAGTLSRSAAVARRSADRRGPRSARFRGRCWRARSACRRFPTRSSTRLRVPNGGDRRAVRAPERAAHLVAPPGRSAAPGLRERDLRRRRSPRSTASDWSPPTGRRSRIRTTVSRSRSGRSPARWQIRSAPACSGSRPAGSTRTPDRARTRRTAPTPT